MEQIFLKEAGAPEFKAAWDLLVLGTNVSCNSAGIFIRTLCFS